MIFIFILVHLLSNNSSAAPVPHPLDARTSTDTCDDINKCRKLFDVVWGCLATISPAPGCQCIRILARQSRGALRSFGEG
jgi:hypothetical protein